MNNNRLPSSSENNDDKAENSLLNTTQATTPLNNSSALIMQQTATSPASSAEILANNTLSSATTFIPEQKIPTSESVNQAYVELINYAQQHELGSLLEVGNLQQIESSIKSNFKETASWIIPTLAELFTTNSNPNLEQTQESREALAALSSMLESVTLSSDSCGNVANLTA